MVSSLLRSILAIVALTAAIGLPGGGAQAAEIAYVATDALNLRDAPSTDGEIFDTLMWGDDVKVIAGPTEDGWYQVVNQGTTGWVTGEYLSWAAVGGGGGRWIDVDRSSGTVTLYGGGEAVASYQAALGWDLTDDGYYATANGVYQIYAMNADLTWSEPGQVYFTHWVAFDPDRANGFHSYPMDEDGNVTAGIETPTGGCVALNPAAASDLFAFAEIGMTVEVHW